MCEILIITIFFKLSITHYNNYFSYNVIYSLFNRINYIITIINFTINDGFYMTIFWKPIVVQIGKNNDMESLFLQRFNFAINTHYKV